MCDKSRRYKELAEQLLCYAETQVDGERVVSTLFTPKEKCGNKDAPGWCRKQARKLLSKAKKSQKNFDSKNRERNKQHS